MNVGLIGLGAMGRGMAASLRRRGHAVHVHDVRPDAMREFVTSHPDFAWSLMQQLARRLSTADQTI